MEMLAPWKEKNKEEVSEILETQYQRAKDILLSNKDKVAILGKELLENEVIFEGDRLEPIFEDVPGQWGTIWLFDGSVNNEINYTTIKNSSIGLYLSGDFQESQEKGVKHINGVGHTSLYLDFPYFMRSNFLFQYL